jgi:hypothetical protein
MRIFWIPVCLFALLCVAAPRADAGRLYARKPGSASPVYNLAQTEVHLSLIHI